MMPRRVPAGVPYEAQPEPRLLSLVPSDEAVAKFLGSHLLPPQKKRRALSVSKKVIETTIRQTKDFMRSGDWTTANALHFVALWMVMHERVYGVVPIVTGNEIKRGSWRAGTVLKDIFKGVPGELVEMIKWSWKREHKNEIWRRENEREGSRLNLTYQFSAKTLTDYKLAWVRGEMR
jgi:hypothetical protein